ncbi:MAG: spore coat protein U domain-containing protein [Spirochaetia bacterium]
MKRLLILAMFVCIVSVGAFANATSTALPVTAFLQSSVAVSATDLDFGNFTLPSPDRIGTAVITVTATSGLVYNVTLDAGQHYVAPLRNVANGASLISYKIMDPTNAFEWGDALPYANTYPAGTAVGPNTGTGAPQPWTVNGTLSLAGLVGSFPAGLYWDFVTVTVNY